jgi:hypothetical protein
VLQRVLPVCGVIKEDWQKHKAFSCPSIGGSAKAEILPTSSKQRLCSMNSLEIRSKDPRWKVFDQACDTPEQ